MTVPNIIKQAARDLRQAQTKSEEALWNMLRRKRGELKVYRQKPTLAMKEDNGLERYVIVDFYFPQGRLVVELDGEIHTKDEIYLLDREKEKLLQNLGYIILRFTNQEVLYNTDIVIHKIAASLPSPKRENLERDIN